MPNGRSAVRLTPKRLFVFARNTQRKVLTPNDLTSLRELEQRIFAFGERYSSLGKPFAWTLTRQELERRHRDPLLQLKHEASSLAA